MKPYLSYTPDDRADFNATVGLIVLSIAVGWHFDASFGFGVFGLGLLIDAWIAHS